MSLDFLLETKSELFIYSFFKVVNHLLRLNLIVTYILFTVLGRFIKNNFDLFINDMFKLIAN